MPEELPIPKQAHTALRNSWTTLWHQLMEAHHRGHALGYGGIGTPEGFVDKATSMAIRNGLVNRARSAHKTLRTRYDSARGVIVLWLEDWLGVNSAELAAASGRATNTDNTPASTLPQSLLDMFEGRNAPNAP